MPSMILGEHGMLGRGDLCREVVADKNVTGATASNPVMGNGTDSTTHCMYTTDGHPGINVAPSRIPQARTDGTYSKSIQVQTIGALLHELSHIYSAGAPSLPEYEQQGLIYAIGEMCKVVNCPAATQEEVDGACKLIHDQNVQLCRLGLKQVVCQQCPGGGTIHCETPPPGPLDSFLGSTTRALDVVVRQFYDAGNTQGTLELDTVYGTLAFDLEDNTGFQSSFVTDFQGVADFIPASFTQMSTGTDIVVGGWNSVSGSGMIVWVVFDPLAGQILSEQVLVEDPRLATVSSIDRLPRRQEVVLGDHISHTIWILDPNTATLRLILDSTMWSPLAATSYVHAWANSTAPGFPGAGSQHLALPRGTTGRNGTLLWCTPWPKQDMGLARIMPASVYLLDQDGDGFFETVY